MTCESVIRRKGRDGYSGVSRHRCRVVDSI